ncbi:MAG: hypothetical protein LBB48_07340 [Treponema sp.]|jgi:hypothetical protein|nr:hypothetical protein [Treponema sp.]
MTLCLFHPLNGVPLIASGGTVAFALKTGNFSDAAFMKKFAERFKRISADLSHGGETCRPRYAIDLHTVTGDTFKITKEAIDEALGNFGFRQVVW